MSLKWLIEQCTDQSAPYATLQEEAFLFVIDAALEYWILRRKIPLAGWISPAGWDDVHGWRCLEAENAE